MHVHGACLLLICLRFPFLFVSLDACFTSPLNDTSVPEHDVARFVCYVHPPDSEVQWFIDDIQILPSAKYHIEAEGESRTLRVNNASKWDEGEICVKLGCLETRANLHVEGEWTEYMQKSSKKL